VIEVRNIGEIKNVCEDVEPVKIEEEAGK